MAELKNFENVLKNKYGLNIEECKETDDWYRFTVKGVEFQGGEKDDVIDLSISLGQVNPDKSFKEIDAEIERVNQKVGGTVKFTDRDGYFAIVLDEGTISLFDSEDDIFSMMEYMIETAKEDIVQAAIAVYGESDY